ncbi:hypothetical protein EUX98_g2870 [Antrodiella citrinella]|uniref:Alpha/beta hydrolase fold-3 domain-containing protein n=1 Tax=Antrodiella citrinella TaxID=2447956 RepID=A0A4S4MXY4_9APHY|nr:hypothetical protein EUX98_g2870 [Antrodiella citrinella]
MGVNTGSAAIHITPVVVKTFYKHTKRKGQKLREGDHTEEATDDILFDEAFHIVKAFIALGTRNTVESLQSFTNTHVPAPYWACVVPLQIPFTSCNKAADALIDWFGPEDLKRVVGGERWWQIRGMDGIDSEWITEKEYLEDVDFPADRDLSEDEANVPRMEHLESVMLYVHGGAFFWGSINTHRYQLIRYARKMKGRVFAVNYRKAPQFPWPCPLQDVLAAYFYLTSPPPGAPHKAVSPSKLVFAGDSAGGGLCLAALTVLRDLGLPQPAGAVLISPWVDLTHSFPSVIKNTATDIIPPHGFVHKPSPLWPVDTLPEDGRTRVLPAPTNPPPRPGHADTLKPSSSRVKDQLEQRIEQGKSEGRAAHSAELRDESVGNQEEMLRDMTPEEREGGSKSAASSESGADSQDGNKPGYDTELDFWEPKPPRVLMNDPEARPLELHSQIQLYAATEQLTHPLVSPVIQGSLGNLCPLYILAGDGEVLRDEIIYLAHKAANPKEYPARGGVLKQGRRQQENVEKFQTPTKVHLQVYDGMCHVLTVFTFTDSAKYAYRSIAEFVKHVTLHTAEHLDRNPFPEFHLPPADIKDDDLDESRRRRPSQSRVKSSEQPFWRTHRPNPPGGSREDVKMYKHNEGKAKEEESKGQTPNSEQSQRRDISGVSMLRERVDVFGHVRPMEPKDQIEALRVSPSEIGLIKEGPVKHWLAGQEQWDKKFKRSATKVAMKRKYYEAKAAKLIKQAREQGLELRREHYPSPTRIQSTASLNSTREVGNERRWGPFDIEGEQPPPSAIVGRRDTRESVALMKMMIYHSAPTTHKTVPKIKTSDAIRAAFDPQDHPTKAPQQSVSEQQIYARMLPIHGVRIWQSLVSYFMRCSARKAVDGKDYAVDKIRTTSDKIGMTSPDPTPKSSSP